MCKEQEGVEMENFDFINTDKKSKWKPEYEDSRKAKNVISFKVNDDDFLEIKTRIESSGMTKTEYCRRTILNQKIINVKALRYTASQIRMIGSNINKIAKVVNQSQNVTPDMIDRIDGYYKGLQEQWESIKQFLQEQA